MRLLTAGLLALGAGLGYGQPAIADGDAFPRYATRDFFDTLQRFDDGPQDIGEVGPREQANRPAPVAAQRPATLAETSPPPSAVVSPPQSSAATRPLAHPPASMRELPSSWPKTIPEAKAEANMDLASRWPDVDVNIAKARCADILRSLDAVTQPEPPVRHGACGAPAPVRLISIGRKPEVAFSPPPLVTCDMVQALHTWITKDVQSTAKRVLGAPIVKVELMSDYSCRNAYGSRHGRLSEHARANAIDIRGFLTGKGEMTAFLEDWGPTGREIREIAAKAARDKVEAARLAAEQVNRSAPSSHGTPAENQGVASQPATAPAAGEALAAAAGLTRSTIAEGLNRIPSIPMSPKGEASVAAGFSRLGGPKPAEKTGANVPSQAAAELAPPNVNGRAAFLREVHDSACKTFGTVLGPEANRAHRNHLHVDMADRSTGVFCE